MADYFERSLISAQSLRKLRRSKEMKQAHLADLMGVSQSIISKWENGALIPNSEKADRLFAILFVPESGKSDDWLYRLVHHSSRQVHLMSEGDHSLIAASRPRIREWRCDYSDVAASPLSRDLPGDIAAAERQLKNMDFELKWRRPAIVNVSGRENGPYCIEQGLLLWEWFMLSDGRLVRLVTNIEDHEVPNQCLRLDKGKSGPADVTA